MSSKIPSTPHAIEAEQALLGSLIMESTSWDKISDKILVARDPIGVVPLYYGITKNNDIMFSSEMKVLKDDCLSISTFTL